MLGEVEISERKRTFLFVSINSKHRTKLKAANGVLCEQHNNKHRRFFFSLSNFFLYFLIFFSFEVGIFFRISLFFVKLKKYLVFLFVFFFVSFCISFPPFIFCFHVQHFFGDCDERETLLDTGSISDNLCSMRR